MNMVPVSSSDISSIGYDGSTLHIRFHSGGLYAYYNVPNSVYSGLMNAASHGRYFHANIKGALWGYQNRLINNDEHNGGTIYLKIKIHIWFCQVCFHTFAFL
ncbi:MAG: KTSC domain-containing protein [Lachnospiraceae bacterium]|nr:KTSC domain-containing protein [Lachnospiraceae bacterium]